MASGEVHIIAGAALTCALTCAFRLPIETIWMGAFASLLPDADTRKSILGRWIPLWLLCQHRGFTHSRLGMCVFSVLCFLCVQNIGTTVIFIAGYVSHLLLDYLTPRGIQWKWPNRTYYRLRRWK